MFSPLLNLIRFYEYSSYFRAQNPFQKALIIDWPIEVERSHHVGKTF